MEPDVTDCYKNMYNGLVRKSFSFLVCVKTLFKYTLAIMYNGHLSSFLQLYDSSGPYQQKNEIRAI